MLVVMQSHATEEQIRAVCQRIERLGLKAHPMPGSLRTAIGITGNKGAIDLGVLESLPGEGHNGPVKDFDRVFTFLAKHRRDPHPRQRSRETPASRPE